MSDPADSLPRCRYCGKPIVHRPEIPGPNKWVHYWGGRSRCTAVTYATPEGGS